MELSRTRKLSGVQIEKLTILLVQICRSWGSCLFLALWKRRSCSLALLWFAAIAMWATRTDSLCLSPQQLISPLRSLYITVVVHFLIRRKVPLYAYWAGLCSLPSQTGFSPSKWVVNPCQRWEAWGAQPNIFPSLWETRKPKWGVEVEEFGKLGCCRTGPKDRLSVWSYTGRCNYFSQFVVLD